MVTQKNKRPSRATPSFGGAKINGQRQVFAALDLGTNNCRLLVATHGKDDFRVIDAFSRIVGLGEGIDVNGVMSNEAMDRAIESLHICAQKLKKRQVTHLRAVATEACRQASNRGEFIDKVRNETGIALDIISPKAEAKLAVEGCQQLFKHDIKKVIVFDIGGGSTEMSAVTVQDHGGLEMDLWVSLPVGVVRLAENLDTTIESDEYFKIVSSIKNDLEPFVNKLKEKDQSWSEAFASGEIQLVGSSGTVTTLAALELGLTSYDRNVVDGSWLKRANLQKVAQNTALITYAERSAIPSIGADRAKLLIPGCAILEAILDHFTIEEICIADRGIREGVLRNIMGLHAKTGLKNVKAAQ